MDSQKKMSVIGSIETLQPKKLQVGATRSLSNNLAGQIAGVIAVQRSGEPGYDSSNFGISRYCFFLRWAISVSVGRWYRARLE